MEKISINKPKIGRIRAVSAKITNWVILLSGFLFVLIDVKSGVYGIVTNIIVAVLYKKMISKWKFWYFVLAGIVFKMAIYFYFDLDYLAYITTSFLTYSIFIPEDLFGKTHSKMLEKNSGVFYMDDKQLKFIHLSIISQKHLYRFYNETLAINEVKMILFSKRRIRVYTKYIDYEVLKLGREEVDQIYQYVRANFPNLLNNPEVIRKIKTKNKVTKIVLISAAFILCFIIINTWAPQGANRPLTYILSALIGISGLWVFGVITRKQ